MMPKLPKQRMLSDVLEPGFAEGYAQFREIATTSYDLSTLTSHEKAFLRAYELASVSMIEMMNGVEDRFGIPPVEAAVALWTATGAALAQVTAQLVVDDGAKTARRIMLKCLKDGYDRGLFAMTGVGEVPS